MKRIKEWFGRHFRAYYLLVVSIIVITIIIQSVTQYSLEKQRKSAKVINIAGQQRLLAQQLFTEFYNCKYMDCNFGEVKVLVSKLMHRNQQLQEGNAALGIPTLEEADIAVNFDRLHPYIQWLNAKFSGLDNLDKLRETDVKYRVTHFVGIMGEITNQFQQQAEEDLKSTRILELELAIFSLLILLFEIFFIVNPIINKIVDQKRRLGSLAWHHFHAFKSHMKNIMDLQFVLKIEKKTERRDEIMNFIAEELEELRSVSNNMSKAFEENRGTLTKAPSISAMFTKVPKKKVKVKKTPIRDGKVHFVES
ncbi:type IV pili methyl-accepting chemotaxis transducer N-terminal domain-containing protein [Flavobacterium sp. ASW18X]|uniref:type IV pili methyl-accepting chemotaxis transducer N-terminal domain-containing protein n=1 Tax=Flavobacterium sp. ASW18X TaxID=2572595 RepID=UPI0010ADFE48|nr:type IV pili methyl-accepting chemotaxis transducer N-terminal domain-containing protein [Flavobacterium sp. ASW18X]TKD60720.1 hypothetical protein FBT53_12610 [Flavobacterium sp. ASW18X]